MAGSENDFMLRAQAVDRLTVAMAGRAAEELLLDGEYTQGAHGDLQSATGLATSMVARFGMGRRMLAIADERFYTGSSTADAVDAEAAELIGSALVDARKVVRRHRRLLEAIAVELLEQETLHAKDLYRLRDEHTRRRLPRPKVGRNRATRKTR